MRRTCLAVCAVYLIAASILPLHPAYAGTPDTKAAPTRGIAVLASSIDSDFTPEGLAEFVQQGKFSPVVVDWAWITYHWDRTDFVAVNRFLDLMAARKVPIAAMYRPRFLSAPTVPTQMTEDGERAVDHAEICYSDPSARQWGISWGDKILEKCPSFKEIIIYNPLNNCHCSKCTAASAKGPHTAVLAFLSEARSAWRVKQPGVKLGVVSMPVPEFWKAGLAVVDVAHPYLRIKEDVDAAKDVANIKAVRSIVKEKMGSCLGKVTWEETAKISMEKLKAIDTLARKNAIPYFFWTFDELFLSDKYDPKAVAQALGMDQSLISEAAGKLRANPPKIAAEPSTAAAPAEETNKPAGSANEPNETQRKTAEALLKQIRSAKPGQATFEAVEAVGKKCRESDAAGRSAMLSLLIATMKNKSLEVPLRWPCCYVISRSGDERGVPDLIQVLLHDESETMRAVAAEALGGLPKNAAAHDALLQAARKETNQWVRETLTRYLGQGMPAPASSSPPSVVGEPNEAQRQSAADLLQQIRRAEPGKATFDAINAVVQKYKAGDAGSKSAILSLSIATMKDKSLDVPLRWPCCYVLSGCGEDEGVRELIQALLQDESETMRAVAAEALGGLYRDTANTAIHDALLQAARTDTSKWVRETIARYLGEDMPALNPSEASSAATSAGGVEELAPSGPPKPPPGPARPVTKPLSWPFPGDYKAQNIFNNYQTMPDGYIHCGLDFIHPAGTPVTAVGPGYVAAIWTHEPHTGDFFIVTIAKGANKGWCYTHLDPQTFTFKEGDFIQQGQLLGKLVKFSVGDKPGMDHLHLNYVTFRKDSFGNVIPPTHSLLDPLYFFDWKDTVPPSFQPLRFMSEGTTQQFQADAAGVVSVKGKADILAAINDVTYPGQESLYGVPLVMLSISDGKHTMQKLVLDHRGDVGDEKQTGPLYLSRAEGRALTNPNSWFPYYQVLRVTKTDGDGKITPRDADECWDTTALDANGKLLWPDGQYSVNVYAWDISGNRGVVGATVQVKNEPRGQ